MKIKTCFASLFLVLCAFLISLQVHAAETEHTLENGICTQCGSVQTNYIQLEDETVANWTLTQDLYLDLNGCDIVGTIDTNNYIIYGMDSTTDQYSDLSVGSFNCKDTDGSPIVPHPHTKTDPLVTGSTRRYMTILTLQGYTFHRFYIGITHTSLKPATTGFGYKAVFYGDDRVLSNLNTTKAFGYKLELDGHGAVDAYKTAEELTSGQTITLRINNWDVENHGETRLYANVYLLLQDGTKISTDVYTITLRQQVEYVNEHYDQFTEAQLKAVKALILKYEVMQSWDVENILNLTYGFVSTPATGTAYKFGVQLPAFNDDYYCFSGEISTYYMSTTETLDASTDVYLEQVTGGYALYFMDGSTKTYINTVRRNTSGSSVKIQLSTSSPTVYTLNTEHKYIYTTIGSRNFYLGTYTNNNGITYTTLSASNTSYIADTSLIGVSQFPAWFVGLVVSENETPDTPAVPPDLDEDGDCITHIDNDNDGTCDWCTIDVTVVIDLYAVNDLHGKIADGDSHPGVDELSTFLNNARETNDNVLVLSSGDMWQGAAESNLTKGLIITEWMNGMDFVSMTMGNHEYDWGEDVIRQNEAIAEFPFLAINIYDAQTNTQVDYCQSSVIVEVDGIQVGIIGAIGDCYSSISVDRSQDVYFITGSELTELVKAESIRLQNQGVDFIIYSIHDGTSSSFSHYDVSLSNGYVDLVFEGHAHQSYVRTDAYGVYHIQAGGDNNGISYANVTYNTANDKSKVSSCQVIETSEYDDLADAPIIAQLLEKYNEQISVAYKVLGTNPYYMYSNEILQIVANLYCQAGEEKWGDEYDIVLGGGYMTCRSPYYLPSGDVTYGMLMNILPFDNRLVLCSISGKNLLNRFINSTHSDYHIGLSDYGLQIASNIDPNGTYYVIVDTYSAYYSSNKLTVVEFYDEDVYARDLLADYIEAGNLN